MEQDVLALGILLREAGKGPAQPQKFLVAQGMSFSGSVCRSAEGSEFRIDEGISGWHVWGSAPVPIPGQGAWILLFLKLVPPQLLSGIVLARPAGSADQGGHWRQLMLAQCPSRAGSITACKWTL